MTDCCPTYYSQADSSQRSSAEKGDRLMWDKKYIEDDPLDDESIFLSK